MRAKILTPTMIAMLTFGGCLSPTAAQTTPTSPAQAVRTALAHGLDVFDALYRQNPGTQPTRNLDWGALTALAIKGDAAAAGRYLRTEFSAQRPDGSIMWQAASDANPDPNATEFATLCWGPILQAYGGKLAPSDRNALRKAIVHVLPALEGRAVPIGYTNIYLMQAVDALLLGAAANDEHASAFGRSHVTAWMAEVRRHGIGEFDSPEYYSVDLAELALGAAMVSDPATKTELREILRYMASDIAAHMTSTRFGAPASRNYDFMGRNRVMSHELALLGFAKPQPGWTVNVDAIPELWAADELARAGAGLGPIAYPHIVESLYGSTGGAATYAYVTPNVEFGTASSGYGFQDKLLDVTFDTETHGGISIDPEGMGDPYGLVSSQKPAHLNVYMVPIQSSGMLLATLDIDPAEAGATNSLTTSLLIPLHAGLAINGAAFDTTGEVNVPLSGGDVFSVTSGPATAAIRIAEVDGVAGTSPSISFITDPIGRANGFGRLVATSYRGARTTLSGHARVILLMDVSDTPGEDPIALLKAARVSATFGAQWSVTATIGSKTFVVEEDPICRRATAGTVNGQRRKMPAPLQVDGQAIRL